MSKQSAKALVKLSALVNNGKLIQIRNIFRGIEVTVFDNDAPKSNHSHYNGTDLIDAINQINIPELE